MADRRQERRRANQAARRLVQEANATRSSLPEPRPELIDPAIEVDENPFRFRGAYTPSGVYPRLKRPREPKPWDLPERPERRRLVAALQQPGIDMHVYRYMADPGFGVPGQSVLQAFDQFDPNAPFMSLDIEWLGTPGKEIFQPTEIALARMAGDDIEVSARLVAPTEEMAGRLAGLIREARSGRRLNQDEWRTLRDLMLYSRSSHMGAEGAMYSAGGDLISQASWARQIPQGEDLRPYLQYAEEGLQELSRRGRSMQDASEWLSQALASATARGEALVSWNGLDAEFPVIQHAFGPQSDVFRNLSRARHLDLMAASRVLSESRLEDIVQQLAGRELTQEEIQALAGGYLRQEELARIAGFQAQYHRAGEDVSVLARLARRLEPILRPRMRQAAVPGAGALEMPGRAVFDPRSIEVGQTLYAIRGGRAPVAVLLENGKEVADRFAYLGTRAHKSYRVQAIRPFYHENRMLFGVQLQPWDAPEQQLFMGFETQDEFFRFFQGFTPAPVDEREIARAARFADEEAARRRLMGFTEHRWGSRSYGFEGARRFYRAAALVDNPASLTADEIRKVLPGATSAEIRDFRLMHARLRSEAGLVGGRGTGVLQAIEEIERAVPEADPAGRTHAFAAFMRRYNELQGYDWRGPLEEVEPPPGRSRGLLLNLPSGETEITLSSRPRAASSVYRAMTQAAQATGPAPGDPERLWAMSERILPALEEAGVQLDSQEMARVLRHSTAFAQAEELAGILIERDLELDMPSRPVPSLRPRAYSRMSKASDPNTVLRMVNESIAEAGRQARAAHRAGQAVALPGDAADLFRRMDEMMRAPFGSSISSRMRGTQEVVTELMGRMGSHGLATTLLIDPDSGRLVMGIAQAEHADQVFGSIYRRGWANRDVSRGVWVELPTIERGGVLTGGRLSRPVLDIVEGDPRVLSRFEYALSFSHGEIRRMWAALAQGSAPEAERIFSRGIGRRLERAPWTRAPWDDPFDKTSIFTENPQGWARLQIADTTEAVVREIAAEMGIRIPPGGIHMMPAADRVRLMEAVQNRVPSMFQISTQLASTKHETVSRYQVGLAEGDIRELYPFGHRLDTARSNPRQALATRALRPESLQAMVSGDPSILPGRLATTARMLELEASQGWGISTATVKAAIVGRQDLLEALDALEASGRLSADEVHRLRQLGLLSTMDEQILVSSRLASYFTFTETREARVAAGEAVTQSRVQAEIRRILEREQGEVSFVGARRDHKTGETILRFELQQQMQQGSRARLGTHKAVVDIMNDELARYFNADVLYYPGITNRGQQAEIAVGQLSKLIPEYSSTARMRERFLRELERETGIMAGWRRGPQPDAPWQLVLPTSGQIPIERIERFVEARGHSLTEELVPGGPRVVTIMGEFARLEQEERALRLFPTTQMLPEGEGIAVGLREQAVMRQHGLVNAVEYARRYGRLFGQEPPIDPEQAYRAIQAGAGRADLAQRTLSSFGPSPLPVREIGHGYDPSALRGTIFDLATTGREAFWLDLELPGYEQATGRRARIAVAPEAPLVVGDERYLGNLNIELRRVVETAEEIRSFNLATEKGLEIQGQTASIDRLYARLSESILRYESALSEAITSYDGAIFRGGASRPRLPGSRLRLHVVDSQLVRLASGEPLPMGTALVAPGYFQEMGISPERPYALLSRNPTDPESIQVVRLMEDPRVQVKDQIAINELTGHAVGGDTDSDVVATFMVDSNVNESIRSEMDRIRGDTSLTRGQRARALRNLEAQLADAEELDRFYRENVLPELERVYEERRASGRPLGVYTEERRQALLNAGNYAQTDDLGNALTPDERIAQATSARLNAAVDTIDPNVAFRETLAQREAGSLIGTLTNELNRRDALAEFMWGADSLHYAQLRAFLDEINQRAISAQKLGTGMVPEEFQARYGNQLAIAVRDMIKTGHFQDLEDLLVRMGRTEKTKTDMSRATVRRNVDLLRQLFNQSSEYWNSTHLNVGLRGGASLEQILERRGPITRNVRYMMEAIGIPEAQIGAMEEASRRFLERTRELTVPIREMAEPVAEGMTRATQEMIRGARVSGGLMGAAIGVGLMAAGWLLPHAIGGPQAELQAPERVEAAIPEGLRTLTLPDGQFPNVQPSAIIPANQGLRVLVRARSPSGITGDELSALMQQAAESAVQLPLSINTMIRDDRSAIDDAWIQQQVAKALS